MTLSLRSRIALTLLPLLVLLAVLGSAGVVILHRLGNSIDDILRENYDSVVAMQNLNEAVERIDSSFQFALAGQIDKARNQYQQNWVSYDYNLHVEENNITLPGEAELVAELRSLSRIYRQGGDQFYQRLAGGPAQADDYFGKNGLLQAFTDIKRVSAGILHLNQDNMEEASKLARQTASRSLAWFALGLAGAMIL